ncbi:hypothetical protein [Alteribacillus bidgolensis]|uniref:Uncharacterized protein n=1 Tax=Alteribacillus bidgolensis TaxID=930129 RepID=A0A1G8MF88_9BACI|nr:hypothetical protein [Alteribacillus bidgolensis]SDI66624.1 hypothetical protein SAMN05216352_11021 [Alteribacillus bidgolensis]
MFGKKYSPVFICLAFILLAAVVIFPLKETTGKDNYYLTLMGDSSTWEIHNYQLKIMPERLIAGDGELHMKDTDEFQSEFFSFDVYAVINNEDRKIQGKSVSGHVNMADMTTGRVEGGTYFNNKGQPITLEDVNEIYAVVEWYDPSKEKQVSEKIVLYG